MTRERIVIFRDGPRSYIAIIEDHKYLIERNDTIKMWEILDADQNIPHSAASLEDCINWIADQYETYA